MNETLQVIENRRSVRTYSNQPVTQAEKNLILKAAFRAPTAGNLMLYSIIEVKKQTLKDRLAITCDNQPFIARAPYVLLFLADYQRWFDYFGHCEVKKHLRELKVLYRKPQAGDLLLACCDALIAAQTAVIAAESLGIGSCYIGDILERYEIHRELFNLPPYVIPITLLCFGHPAPALRVKRTTRFSKQAIVHQNTYHRFEGKELEKVFYQKEKQFAITAHPSEFKSAGQLTYTRKFAADFTVEMNRSVKEMLKNWE